MEKRSDGKGAKAVTDKKRINQPNAMCELWILM